MIKIRRHLPSRDTVAAALAKLTVRRRTPRAKSAPTRAATPGHTVAVVLATLAALAVATSAFTRSFSALSDLAVMHQWPAGEAWILPVALDGMIVVPTVAAVVRRDARWYAWSLLVAGTILSCAGNGVHAWLTASSQIAVALAIVPPLVTFFAVHLAIVIARQDRDTTTVAAVASGPASDVAPDDHDKTARDNDRDDETPRPVRRLRVAPATTTETAAAERTATDDGATQQMLTLDVATTATDTAPVATTPSPTPRTRTRRTKHDESVRAEAIRRVANGSTLRDVADQLGVSKDAVWRWTRDESATVTAAV
ncbi:helix-turn-helix domain-containing protein [Rhodococcus zopfii]|uniref:Helix-turn-helix domain-containing protein n=1 Tax=Rhodococcus zopfii TaxID=43772 RepID=A0ABU3WU91_9NOCA|nr:helix-turn-helix domain-containing protein [Rhodococcus zopfii]